jgi:hypothetical protein
MPDPDFLLTSDFYFPSEDSPALDLQEVIALLKDRIPTATIDFERGRQQVEANIERLKALGAPGIIYQGEYQLIDRTICVEIPVPGRSEVLTGYTTCFSYYDGCLNLECTPFHIEVLKSGALFVARSLELDLSLTSSSNLEIGVLCKPERISPPDLIAERFADLVSVTNVTSITVDWETRLESACLTWLNEHPAEQTTNRWKAIFPDGHSLARSLINRLTSMGSVCAASIVNFDREFWHSCLVLEYDEWSGLVNLSGLPQALFDDRSF